MRSGTPQPLPQPLGHPKVALRQRLGQVGRGDKLVSHWSLKPATVLPECGTMSLTTPLAAPWGSQSSQPASPPAHLHVLPICLQPAGVYTGPAQPGEREAGGFERHGGRSKAVPDNKRTTGWGINHRTRQSAPQCRTAWSHKTAPPMPLLVGKRGTPQSHRLRMANPSGFQSTSPKSGRRGNDLLTCDKKALSEGQGEGQWPAAADHRASEPGRHAWPHAGWRLRHRAPVQECWRHQASRDRLGSGGGLCASPHTPWSSSDPHSPRAPGGKVRHPSRSDQDAWTLFPQLSSGEGLHGDGGEELDSPKRRSRTGEV